MKHHFDPGEVQALCKAFDVAWRAVEKEATTSNCEAIRDHMGRAIVRMAMSGKMNERRLASYGAYSARLFLGRRVGSITLPCDTARM